MSSASKIAVAVLWFAILPLAVLLPPGLPAAAAEGPPKLDVTESCNAAARGALSAGRDREACLADEHTAEATLGQSWSKFSDADKTQCIGNVKTGGPPSYVELLSCLEVMKDAKESRESDPMMLPQAPPPPARRRK